MGEITRRYLKLPEFCRLTGLSASTVRRRVREGSIPVEQPGGPKHLLLFGIDALEHAPKTSHASLTATDSQEADGDHRHGPVADQPSVDHSDSYQRGPGPKWKRELAAFQISTPKSTTE